MGHDLAALRAFLPRTPFFGGLDDTQLDLLIPLLVPRTFDAGATVFEEGVCGRSMYVIETGQLVVWRRGDSGHRVRMVRLGAGDFFGETTLIEMQPRPSTVVCETHATLYELTGASLYKLYRADVKAYVLVLQNINRELCRRLRRADNRITQIADENEDEVTQIKSS